MYVGAQVGTWSYFIQYVQDYVHQPERVAGYFLTGTLAAFAIGRFSSSYLMALVKPHVLMGIYSLTNVCLVLLGVLAPGWIGLWALVLHQFLHVGYVSHHLCDGPERPGSEHQDRQFVGSLWRLSEGRFLTPAMGYIGEHSRSLAVAYLVPLVSYLVVAYYAFLGSRLAQRAESSAS